ncbi:hypothetical protein IAQ61_004708 [Plenodomus lingam]|uniref:Similar to pigment biosynthesis protein yellowish-green 1 n=1 Tax=Leptosphaeria maculans (strain JN3 / isolate v23.1.3 / race Av1-4-5-6-7-8) TaxID=985895 RepID=E4ZWA7_LEPMJ|nr:similar to pigment biosynthesis protein yellowish-green 1 [Plenodomus lingam JN3]KAH9874080.1 hypothetical protein IAQ61_004708 [Plenodomus lingam]CBX95883.1 similar to pigment biosynthesis protein yellowish-green 1 [Plenodomus lingam JN3]
MAATDGKFFIEDKLGIKAKHHESFEQLWETKWKKPAEMGVYPFMFSTATDFQPVVDQLVAKNFKEPYDWDAYASTFFPQAQNLASIAAAAEANGEREKASEYYLRSSAVYRIARFPAPRSPVQKEAWELGKKMCIKGLGLLPHAVQEINIPHIHRLPNEGPNIPIYHLVPPTASPTSPCPTLIIFTGLDGYRTELCVWMSSFLNLGIATIVLEIPGTADCPADPSDPTSPDRLYSSLFAWTAHQPRLAQDKIALWAFSTGAYYGIRVAHTHAHHLAGVAALGGGAHYMFSPRWLDRVNELEYPFDLAETLAQKFGYASVAAFKREAQAKFSLLEDGTLDRMACARLLLVNGTLDEVFPIDDYLLCVQRGAPKEVRFVQGGMHMGEPESFFVVLRWLYGVLGVEGDPAVQLGMVPFKPKY